MMMKSRDLSLTIALCASLTVHAALVQSMAERYVHSVGSVKLPGFQRQPEGGAQLVLLRAPVADPDELLGNKTGGGKATDDSPGESELQSKKAAEVEQPALSRDLSGPGRTRGEPAQSTLPPGRGGRGGDAESADAPSAVTRLPFGVESASESVAKVPPASPSPPPTSVPPVSPALSPPAESAISANGENSPKPEIDPATPPPPTAIASAANPILPAPQAPPAASAPEAASGPPGKPGAPVAPADAAPQGDSESDPFTVIGGAEFRPGRTRAQVGRPHKITHPRIDLGGLVDSIPLGRLRCVLQLTIDHTGHVVNVKVIGPSGSDNVDQACRVAAYEWWFEPKTGKDGKPRTTETFVFGIEFK